MKRVNISIPDETYEELRLRAFEQKVQPGTLAALIIGWQMGKTSDAKEPCDPSKVGSVYRKAKP